VSLVDERLGVFGHPRGVGFARGADLLEPRAGRLDHGADRKAELPGELEVALVVRRHRHDRAPVP